MGTQQAISSTNNQLFVESNGNKTRHSNAFIQEMKDCINQKIEKANEMLQILEGMYMNDKDNGTEDTASTFKIIEHAADLDSKNMNIQLATRQRTLIADLKDALIRIENKTYGICKTTGKLISEERLRAAPHATMSIEAKQMRK